MGATQAQTFLSLFIIKSIIKIETRGNGKIRNLYTCTSVNVLDYALNLSISVEVSRKKLVKRSFILNIYLIRSSKSIIGLWSMYIYLSVFCLLNMHCADKYFDPKFSMNNERVFATEVILKSFNQIESALTQIH